MRVGRRREVLLEDVAIRHLQVFDLGGAQADVEPDPAAVQRREVLHLDQPHVPRQRLKRFFQTLYN